MRRNHPWHVYSKELSGGLCKACVLFDKSTTNRGIFVKNIFQDVSKPEEITEHARLHYHLAAMVEAERFIKVMEIQLLILTLIKIRKNGTIKTFMY